MLSLSLLLPSGLKGCIGAEGLSQVTGHSRAGDPSPPKETASHVNEHKNIKTAFMFVQPFAHSYISQPFRDKAAGGHHALGGTYAWPHFCQKYHLWNVSGNVGTSGGNIIVKEKKSQIQSYQIPTRNLKQSKLIYFYWVVLSVVA